MGSVTVVKVLGQRVRWVCSSADAPGAFCLTLSRPFPAPASGACLSPLSAVLFPFWWTSRHRHVPAVLVAFERRVGFGLLVAFALELSFLLGPLDPGLGAQFTLLALGLRRRVDGHPLLTNWHRTTTVGGAGRAQQHRRDSPSAVWSPPVRGPSPRRHPLWTYGAQQVAPYYQQAVRVSRRTRLRGYQYR